MARSLYARLTRRYRPGPTRLERREFLKLTLAASAGLLVSPISSWSANGSRPGRGRRVIVVGAGFSGLACADSLLSAGYEVSVLEARSRIGGRVISFGDLVRGKVVEGGGELIGSNHPTWAAYAKKFGLRFNDVTENEELHGPVLLDGRRLTEKESKTLWHELDAAYSLMNADAATVDADRPWLSPNATRFDERATAKWISTLRVSGRAKRAIDIQLAADNGVATSRQSYLGVLTQVKGGGLEKYWTETEVYRCRGGNALLARKLAEAIGAHRLRLGVAVREIRTAENRVSVTDAVGCKEEADDLVLAVPPSTWHNIRFYPVFPRVLRPQMGINVKYLATVKSRFWEKNGLAPDSTTDGIVSMTWDGTDNQGSDAEGAVLNCFSGGPQAERARQRWATRKETAYIEALSEIYPSFSQSFLRGRFMNWPNEIWTGAGYSCPAPGQVTTVGPILHAGLGRLHFAGEHACYKFVGYMEGALNSGVSVAKRIVARDAGRAIPVPVHAS